MTSKQQPKQSRSKLEVLREKSQRAEQGGGPERLEKQHAAGKLTARERIEFLLDDGSFEEFDKLVVHRSRDFGMDQQLYPGDGVVRYSSLLRTSQCLAVPCPRLMRRKSAKSWTWR